MGLIAAGVEANLLDRPGGIFVRAAEQISEEDKVLMQTVARVDHHRHARHARRADRAPRAAGSRRCRCSRPRRAARPTTPSAAAAPRARPDPRRTASAASRPTAASTSSRPAPGSRRRRRGSTCSPIRGSAPSSARAAARTRGARTRTSFASRPWHNDPVSDASGEAFYLRDEETGRFWSPTPLPARARRRTPPARFRLQRLRARRGGHRTRS